MERQKNYQGLPCIKFNATIILLKHVFHLSLHAAKRNTEKKKYYESFYTSKFSSSLLNLVKNVNKPDFEVSKQISPIKVY